MDRAKQRIDSALRQRFAVRLEKLSEPDEVGSCTRRDHDWHGWGGGNSLAEPQLRTHASAASAGIDSPVCS